MKCAVVISAVVALSIVGCSGPDHTGKWKGARVIPQRTLAAMSEKLSPSEMNAEIKVIEAVTSSLELRSDRTFTMTIDDREEPINGAWAYTGDKVGIQLQGDDLHDHESARKLKGEWTVFLNITDNGTKLELDNRRSFPVLFERD